MIGFGSGSAALGPPGGGLGGFGSRGGINGYGTTYAQPDLSNPLAAIGGLGSFQGKVGSTPVDANGMAPQSDMFGNITDPTPVQHDKDSASYQKYSGMGGQAVGTVVGSFFGAPQLGGMAGKAAGQNFGTTIGDLFNGKWNGVVADLDQTAPPGMSGMTLGHLLNINQSAASPRSGMGGGGGMPFGLPGLGGGAGGPPGLGGGGMPLGLPGFGGL